tara:strand:- start:139 stop:933 length:795 start_codon:yes stop_codon:yes gene_type:complete
MNAIALGPLLFSAERFAAIVGIVAFYIVMVAAGRVVKRPLGDLALTMILAGGVGARLVHVLFHIESFAPEPLRILYIWQGGFNIWGSILGLLGVALWKARRLPVFAGTAAAGVVGFGLWGFILLLSQQTSSAPLPRTALETLDGERINLAQFQGEPLVINLWATWCPPCVREMPMFAKAAQDNPDIAFAFVNQGEGRSEIEQFLTAQNLDLEHVILDPYWSTSGHYESRGLPTTLFIDADGTISATYPGEVSPELMNEQLAALQ